jgi:hypothetical protein
MESDHGFDGSPSRSCRPGPTPRSFEAATKAGGAFALLRSLVGSNASPRPSRYGLLAARGARPRPARRASIDQSATAITSKPAATSTNTEISPRVVSSSGEP